MEGWYQLAKHWGQRFQNLEVDGQHIVDFDDGSNVTMTVDGDRANFSISGHAGVLEKLREIFEDHLRPRSAPADPGLSRANQPIETRREWAIRSGIRKAVIARPEWLIASVTRNIGPICRPLEVTFKRQIG